MWGQAWGYREGLAVGLGLCVAGIALQRAVGPIDWGLLEWPRNGLLGAGLLAGLWAMHALRRRVYLFRWLGGRVAAVASLLWVAAITVVMGFVRQHGASHPPTDWLGFTRMLSSWPFALLYAWMLVVLGLAMLRAGRPRRWGQLPFWLNHLGLFVVLLAGVLGHADMRRLRMTCRLGQPEWRAQTEEGLLQELPLAIELQRFTIEEYPPRLVAVDHGTGRMLPEGAPHQLLLEDSLARGRILDWDVRVLESIPLAGSMVTADTVRFVPFHSMGGTYAALVEAVHRRTGHRSVGWVSCGSFAFPYKALRLDSTASLVMPEREPRRFASDVTIYTQAQEVVQGTIEVNRPMGVAGWRVYQLSYDEGKGRWSDVSVLELVRDPWLPAVYVGIGMLMLGAVGLFAQAQRRAPMLEEGL